MSDYITTMGVPENYKHEFLNNILKAANIHELSKFRIFQTDCVTMHINGNNNNSG